MLPSQRDVFVLVVPGDKNKGVLGAEIRDRPGDSVTGNAKSAHQLAVLVKRNAAGRTVERTTKYRLNRGRVRARHFIRARCWAEQNHAAGSSEFVDVIRWNK